LETVSPFETVSPLESYSPEGHKTISSVDKERIKKEQKERTELARTQ